MAGQGSSKGRPWKLFHALTGALETVVTSAGQYLTPAPSFSSASICVRETTSWGRAGGDDVGAAERVREAVVSPVRLAAVSSDSRARTSAVEAAGDGKKNKTKVSTSHAKTEKLGSGERSFLSWYRNRLHTLSLLVVASLFAGGIVYIIISYIQRYRKRVADYDATSVKLGREARAQECVSDHFSSLQRLPGLGMAPLRCAIRQTMDLSNVTTPLVNARAQKQASETLGAVAGEGGSNGSIRPAIYDHPLTPAAKLRLWEQYKVHAFARVLLAEFSMAATILMLRIHLNLLGRQLFLAGDDADAEREGLTEQTQQHFLLLAEGISNREATLKDLARDAIAASQIVIGNVSLKAKLTRADLRKLLKSAMKEMASNTLRVTTIGSKSNDSGVGDADEIEDHDIKNVLSSFLGEGISASAETSAGRLDSAEMLALKNLSHQSKDVLHSKSCNAAVLQSVSATHEIALRRIAKDMASQRSNMEKSEAKEKSAEETKEEDILDTPIPLAKLIPSIERASLEILDDCEDLEESMAKNPSIISFFGDVYAGVVHKTISAKS